MVSQAQEASDVQVRSFPHIRGGSGNRRDDQYKCNVRWCDDRRNVFRKLQRWTLHGKRRLLVSGGLSVGVDVSPSTRFPPGTGSASANFFDDFVFTVNGGIGNGFFFPCFSGSSDAGTSVSIGLAGIGLSISDLINISNCGLPPFFPAPKPFTFGVPQIVQVGMTGSGNLPLTREAGAAVGLDHILFFDPSGNQLSNVTFTLVEVPEPSARSLLSIGLIFLLAVRIRRM